MSKRHIFLLDQHNLEGCYPPDKLADNLTPMASVISGDSEFIALTLDDASITQLFQRHGYHVIPVSGNRSKARRQIEARIEDSISVVGDDVPDLTIVTGNVEWEDLAWRMSRRKSNIRVWLPKRLMNSELNKPEYHCQDLEKLLPELRVASVTVLIDFENIFISLTKDGFAVNLHTLIDRIKEQAAKHGRVDKIIAIADWEVLREHYGYNAQPLLEEAGIEPVYVRSLHGKSSSDTKLIQKAQDLLTLQNAPDVFIIASGDRDFRSLIETLKRASKRVVLWGVQGSTNPLVSEAADQVEWFNDFVGIQRTQHELERIRVLSEVVNTNATIDPMAELALKFHGFQLANGWTYLTFTKLVQLVAGSENSQAQTQARQLIDQAKAEGVLQTISVTSKQGAGSGLVLNEKHPAVAASNLIVERTHDRIRHALEVRKMPFVTFKYVATSLGEDTELNSAGLAKTFPEQQAWLNLMMRYQLLRKSERTSPYRCTTLVLPEKNISLQEVVAETAERMRRRVITHTVAHMTEHKTDWMPIILLHRQLKNYGETLFQNEIKELETTGDLRKEQHLSEKNGHNTLGIHLQETGRTVARERQALKQALDTLSTLARADGELSDPAKVERDWLEVLEGVRLLYKQGPTWRINRNHALLAGLDKTAGGNGQIGTQPAVEKAQTAETKAPVEAAAAEKDTVTTGGNEQIGAQPAVDKAQTAEAKPILLLPATVMVSNATTAETVAEKQSATLETGLIRKLLVERFSDEDIDTLAFDHFRAVYRQFAVGMTKSKKIHLLLEHTEIQQVQPQLWAEVQRLRPGLNLQSEARAA